MLKKKRRVGNAKSLIQAVQLNELSSVKLLLRQKELPSSNDANGWTSIHHAASLGRDEILQILLKSDPSNTKYFANLQTWCNETPLMVACQASNPSTAVCRALVDAGAVVSLKTLTDNTAIMYACEKVGSLPVVKFLIEKGARLDEADNINGFTPLHYAIMDSKDLELIRYLIPISDLTATNAGGEDALQMAISRLPEIVLEILEAMKSPPRQCHIKRAATFRKWDLFLKFVEKTPSLHITLPQYDLHHWILPFHLAWDFPPVLKKTLSLTPETAFVDYWTGDGAPIEDWIEVGHEESVRVYLQHIAPMSRQNPLLARWMSLTILVKKYFSPHRWTLEPYTNLQQACRIPARYHIRKKCGSDWKAYCWIRDSKLPVFIKKFLYYESN